MRAHSIPVVFPPCMIWQTSKRKLSFDSPLVMGILNVTPDSFSDGGEFLSTDAALRHAEKLISEGVDIIDIGGESTRPGSQAVSIEDEIARVVPVIEAITKRFETCISVDTSKSEVAERAIDAGAEIINDISGLRFDPRIADIAASLNAGLVLMHSRGSFETMHGQETVEDIFSEVKGDLHRAIESARCRGVSDGQIALDIGIGFSKTPEQNLELLAKLGKIVAEFKGYPMLVGASRKSFIAKICGDRPANERLGGSLAAAMIAVQKGARIVRVHDVRETVSAINLICAISD